MIKADVFDALRRDLKAIKHAEEGKENYCARLLYSGISFWLKTITLDKDILCEEKTTMGVSKAYLKKRCEKIFNEYLALYPFLNQWYYPDSNDKSPIDIIRQRMFKCGEIVEIGFNNNVAIPSYKEYKLTDNIIIVRGLNTNLKLGFSSGLSWLKHNRLSIENMVYIEKFKSQETDAIGYTKSFMDEVRWERVIQVDGFEFFDVLLKKPLSQCWRNDYFLKEGEKTIARRYLGHNVYEYSVLKNYGGSLWCSNIDEHLRKEKEIIRLLIGLKAIANNPVKANLRNYPEEGLIEINMYSKLPRREESLLLLLGWPKNSVLDTLNLIFVEDVREVVVEILRKLNIKLQEEFHG